MTLGLYPLRISQSGAPKHDIPHARSRMIIVTDREKYASDVPSPKIHDIRTPRKIALFATQEHPSLAFQLCYPPSLFSP